MRPDANEIASVTFCESFRTGKDGRILRIYRHPKFPRLCIFPSSPVPDHTLFHRAGHRMNVPSAIAEARPEAWLQSEWGHPMPELCEQVYPQREGFALIMLSAEVEEEDEDYDPDADRTAKQRYQERRSRWQN